MGPRTRIQAILRLALEYRLGLAVADIRPIPPMATAPPNMTPRDATSGCAFIDTTAAVAQTMTPMKAKPAPAAFLPIPVLAICSPSQ